MNGNPLPTRLVPHRLEDRWLVAAAREVLLEVPAGDVPPASGVDWPFLLRQASLHALRPCLARYCEQRRDEIPEAVRTALDRELTDVRAYNFFLVQELGRLTAALNARGLKVLAWKGPALAFSVYGDPALRQCADLDLMVSPEQMGAAVSVLQELGYQEMAVETGGHTRNLARQSPKAVVELHEMVVQPHFSVSVPTVELLEGADSVRMMGAEIPVPAPEKLFLMLCVHGSKHVWERLIWICDVVLFARHHPGLDWPALWALARRCRAERMLRISVLMAELLAPGAIPEGELATSRQDETAAALTRKAVEWLFVPESSHALSLGRSWFQIQMRESFSDRWPLIHYYLRKSTTPDAADKDVVQLPRPLRAGYRLIRPIRLLAMVLLHRK